MKYDFDDFKYLETVRDHLRRNFVGIDECSEVFWLPYHNVLGHGKHSWYIKIRYVTESNDFANLYDRELNICAEYPGVLFSFVRVRGSTYASHDELLAGMNRSGFVCISAAKADKV